MSGDDSSAQANRIPANDELVNSLIEDFKATCDIKPNDSKLLKPEEGSSSRKDGGDIDEFSEENLENPSQQKPKPDDYIDEDELKTKELAYSEEDFQKLKSEAEVLKIKGNDEFKNKEYMQSAQTYTLALRTCPLRYPKDRAILYANRAAAKIKLELSESAIEDSSKAIELEPSYIKALLRRAQLYETSDKLDEALEDFKKILEYDSSHREAMEACMRLPPIINERNEKMKTEMMGKLKDLGNMILKPFGLSTNNFQMVQDPNTGGYSISFKQN
ncbi:tetratricopeptide repeat protein 1 [Halyomorpha halys]|uniref:tetratricopeptide repeat protein 1 n=1 Tax=Halyomorpha halys TaxID=286706 RepID=UPI0006D4CC9B|nr:tetratricopeptide repeat protein 1 [Halyomorpha halys]